MPDIGDFASRNKEGAGSATVAVSSLAAETAVADAVLRIAGVSGTITRNALCRWCFLYRINRFVIGLMGASKPFHFSLASYQLVLIITKYFALIDNIRIQLPIS